MAPRGLSKQNLMHLDDLLSQLADADTGAAKGDLTTCVWQKLGERRRRIRRVGVALHGFALVCFVSASFLVSHSQAQTALNQQVVAIALSQSMAPMEAY